MRKIDEADAKIIQSLLHESRTSFTELAQICDLSITAIIRRYNRLRNSGIICAENMHLNPLSVGYQSMAEIGIMTDLADKEIVAHALSNKQSVNLTAALGKYNIYGVVVAQTLSEMMKLVEQVDMKRYVKSLDLLIYADLSHSPWHPENLVIEPLQKESNTIIERPVADFESVLLDETDKRLARLLVQNSRMPFNEIAKQLQIPIKSVFQRYKNLREKNAFHLSTISVDPSMLGFVAVLDTYINVVNREGLPELEKQLLQIRNLTFCAKYVGGAYDLRVAIPVSGFSEVFELQKKINSMGNIKKAEHYLHEIPQRWIMNTGSIQLLS